MNSLVKKHGKTILAILGAFLMITFLVPSVVRNSNDVGALEVGRLNGKKVLNREIQSANFDLTVLARFGYLGDPYTPGLLTIGSGPSGYVNVPVAYLYDLGNDTHSVERGTHWFLLLQEARNVGLIPNQAEITERVNQRFPDHDKLIEILYKVNNITENDFRNAIGDALIIRNRAMLLTRSIPVSVPELEFYSNESFSQAQVDYTQLDAARDFADAPAPTPDQIQKQFDAYKSIIATPPSSPDSTTPPATLPTINGHKFPFGYKYPDRVKAEYLKFDRSEIATLFQPTREDVEAAFRYYTSHPDDPAITIPRSDNFAVTSQPAQKTFDQVRDLLVQRQINDRIDKFLKRITDRVSGITAAPWANAKDDGGFREPIPRSQWVDYKSIPGMLKSMPEFNGYQPQYGAISDFESARRLALEPGIGLAAYDNQGTPIPFSVLATHVHELGDFPNFPRLYLQVGIDAPLVKDPAGNLYLFRVTDADKTHDPATLDEVRPQVIDDLKKVATYQQKQSEAKEIAELATTRDFSVVAHNKGLTVATTPEFRHSQSEIPGVGAIPGFADAAFEIARGGVGGGGQSATQPASSQPASQPTLNRTTTVSDDAALKVYVLVLKKYTPVTGKEFADRRSDMIEGVSREMGLVLALEWLNFDATVKRMNYVPFRPFSTR
ncbi:MAG TPA: hypothetical protein VM008_08160 [Phycisphaerae bacterium]|nr:hypothetical protein [Phycisphaerae bacterium]